MVKALEPVDMNANEIQDNNYGDIMLGDSVEFQSISYDVYDVDRVNGTD